MVVFLVSWWEVQVITILLSDVFCRIDLLTRWMSEKWISWTDKRMCRARKGPICSRDRALTPYEPHEVHLLGRIRHIQWHGVMQIICLTHELVYCAMTCEALAVCNIVLAALHWSLGTSLLQVRRIRLIVSHVVYQLSLFCVITIIVYGNSGSQIWSSIMAEPCPRWCKWQPS